MSQVLTIEYFQKSQEACQNKFGAKLENAVGYAAASKRLCEANEHEIFEVKTELTDIKRDHAVDREIVKNATDKLDTVVKFSKIIAGLMAAIFAAISGGYGLIWAFWCSPAGKSIIGAALQVSSK
jgi:hypothetical protein